MWYGTWLWHRNTVWDSSQAHDPFSQRLPASGKRDVLFFSFLLSLSLVIVHATVLGENTAFYPWLPPFNKLCKLSVFKILIKMGDFLTSSIFVFWKSVSWLQPQWKLPKTNWGRSFRRVKQQPRQTWFWTEKWWGGAWWMCHSSEGSARLGTPHCQRMCLLLILALPLENWK